EERMACVAQVLCRAQKALPGGAHVALGECDLALGDAALGETGERIEKRTVVTGLHHRRDRLQLADFAASVRRGAQRPFGRLLMNGVFEELHAAHTATLGTRTLHRPLAT